MDAFPSIVVLPLELTGRGVVEQEGKSRVGHSFGGGLREQLHGAYFPAGLKTRTVKFPAGLKTMPFRVGRPIEPKGFIWVCCSCLYLPLLILLLTLFSLV